MMMKINLNEKEIEYLSTLLMEVRYKGEAQSFDDYFCGNDHEDDYYNFCYTFDRLNKRLGPEFEVTQLELKFLKSVLKRQKFELDFKKEILDIYGIHDSGLTEDIKIFNSIENRLKVSGVKE